MGSLFGSLLATAGALRTFDRSLTVIQNNVANASTPGYVSQRLTLSPKRFDPRAGLAGGVDAGPMVSNRDDYSERNVWRQASLFGRQSQQSADLQQIEPFFNISQDSGIPSTLNKFFNSVSSLSVNPNDPVSRQVVLDQASNVARAFNQNATALGEAASSADRQIRQTVDHINSLASTVRDLNVQRRNERGTATDPALDAKLYDTLEELSQYTDFNVVKEADGSIQLLLGGQTPLVIGDRLQKIRADFSTPQPAIVDENGNDITGQVQQGTLKGLLDSRNTRIPGYQADLDKLAQAFADNVNQVLAGGVDASGSNPTVDLFTYDSTAGSAATLKVNPLDPSQIAAADPGAPLGNGNALRLAALTDEPTVDGVTFNEFYGQLGAQVGRDVVTANDGADLQQQLLSQARSLRDSRSGVSLDEEAARLVEAQRAYEANAQLFQVLNSLTDTLIGILK
ncbi:MAG: flagellar hook-associated protein FlgK [Bryobacterales bacterium]|nr:flagellar hook-associated protein FlgK [Bryobacterales bacterium]